MEAKESPEQPDPALSPRPSALDEESAATYCATHPKVETYLRCGRCEKPICPQCLYMTPVGARCRECARLKKLPMFEVGPLDYLRGLAGGVAAAAIGGILLQLMPGFGFFGLLLMLGLGYVVGEATTRAARRKRGTGLAIVGALAVPLGIVVGRAGLLLLAGGGRFDAVGALTLAGLTLAFPIWNLLALLVAMAIAASRIR